MSRIVRVTQNSTGNWWVDLHSRFPAMLVDSSSVDQWLAAGGLSRDDLAFDGRRSQNEFEERFGSRVESRSEAPRGVVSPT